MLWLRLKRFNKNSSNGIYCKCKAVKMRGWGRGYLERIIPPQGVPGPKKIGNPCPRGHRESMQTAHRKVPLPKTTQVPPHYQSLFCSETRAVYSPKWRMPSAQCLSQILYADRFLMGDLKAMLSVPQTHFLTHHAKRAAVRDIHHYSVNVAGSKLLIINGNIIVLSGVALLSYRSTAHSEPYTSH